jgi:hypothetical protein
MVVDCLCVVNFPSSKKYFSRLTGEGLPSALTPTNFHTLCQKLSTFSMLHLCSSGYVDSLRFCVWFTSWRNLYMGVDFASGCFQRRLKLVEAPLAVSISFGSCAMLIQVGEQECTCQATRIVFFAMTVMRPCSDRRCAIIPGSGFSG